jgi:hypothetical protein
MKTKCFFTSIILWFFIFFPPQSVLNAASVDMLTEFKFYNIGYKDTMETAKDKLDSNGFDCGSGKSTYLDIRSVQKQMKGRKAAKKLETIMAMDKDLEDYGKGLPHKKMPINVIACNHLENSPIKFSTYFFSGFDQKILAISIEIEKSETVKDKFISKYGTCMLNAYCESRDSLIIFSQNHGLYLNMYFFENLKFHHKKAKELKALKDKKDGEKIDEAF